MRRIAALTYFVFMANAQVSNNDEKKPLAVDEKKKLRAEVRAKTMSGDLKVSHIVSCSTIDKIPQIPRSDGRRVRRIFRDELKYDRDKKPSMWELHQVLRPSGEVSFVFFRDRADGKAEYLAAKGDTIERYIEISKGKRRMVGKENLKPLINRMGISFIHENGSRVEFIPGQTGRSTVVLYPTNDVGVGLSPVLLAGISCDKPASFLDDDVKVLDLPSGASNNEGKEK
jgi:hypothetical protein